MAPHRSRRHTRSDNLTPNENLEKYFNEHIKFLQREKQRVERFFRENGIKGNDLETKLRELETFISDREKQIKQLEKTHRSESQVINDLHVERGQFINRIQELELENRQLRQDLEYERLLNERRIANLSIQLTNSQHREEIFSEELYNREGVRTIPPFRRQGALIYEDEILEIDDSD
ncbi:13980_t:CDS:2 [Cetraspora pellucida]|uniref:13980_t:CDS:1 n=1 Tax=Cetraspora pellucida TaxID=1433469 RepID=A0ACA9MEL1_9GLOM|nr:13980_t:CDS:2 [Cetraspora pellucida]